MVICSVLIFVFFSWFLLKNVSAVWVENFVLTLFLDEHTDPRDAEKLRKAKEQKEEGIWK